MRKEDELAKCCVSWPCLHEGAALTRVHKARLVAAVLGLLTFLLALMDVFWPSPLVLLQAGDERHKAQQGRESEVRRPGHGHFRRRNPFGIVRIHPPPAPPPSKAKVSRRSNLEPVKAPKKITLPLKLLGTVSAGPFGMAFLAPQKAGAQLALGVGADLGDSLGSVWKGWILDSVERRAVVFRRGNQIQRLDLGSKEGKQAATKVSHPTSPRRVLPGSTQILPRSVSRAEVDRARNNLAFLVTQLSVQPFFERGKPAGVRVSRIRPGSFPARMGLMNGDILRGVGGKPIKNLKDTLALNQAMSGGGTVKLDLLRGGRSVQMQYQIH
jgi:type II secretory pathway component PulC